MLSARTRRWIAAAIPLVYSNLSFALRACPVVCFLLQFAPVNFVGLILWALSAVGVVAGIRLSSSPRLFEFEKDGRLYKSLGVRQLRLFIPNGDWMVRTVNVINPGSYERLNRSSLATRRAFHRDVEQIHWALVGGTLPALVWAAILGRSGTAWRSCRGSNADERP
jgi:Glycosyl-4,4'-diaponeurosporenoate acyltransferase